MGIPFVQIGIRSLSPEEVYFRHKENLHFIDAVTLYHEGITDVILPPDFPDDVYITFDVDGLDPSVIGATGTPEPGGLTWWQAMGIVKKIALEAHIAGFDVVELAPKGGDHASDFAAARLVYNLMGFAGLNSNNRL